MDMVPSGFFEQSMQEYFNLQPSMIKGTANVKTEYYKRYLYRMIYSVFKFNLPKDWNPGFFRFWLFHSGSIACVYTSELGWIMSPYGVSKIDWQYQPKVITVTNHELPEVKTGIIGVNAEIIKLFDDYRGLEDLVIDYAEKLAAVDKAFQINLMNCNVSKLFQADDKKHAEQIKEAYDRATEGQPMVVMHKDSINGDRPCVNLLGAVRQDMILDELQTAKRRLLNEFLTKIGIRNANYDKKERLNSQEVSENNDETRSIVSVMLENLERSFALVNSIAPLGLSVELRYNYDDLMEVMEDA